MAEATPRMRYVGLDAHKETITVAVAEEAGRPEAWGTIANDPQAVRRLVRQLSRDGHRLKLAYEAGPTGYVLQRQLSELGVECQVVAPSLIPKSTSGRRMKTDTRDAEQLAKLLRSGDLYPIWVPDQEHEAFREVVRARFVVKKDLERHRHQMVKLLLRWGLRPPASVRRWSKPYRRWLAELSHPLRDLQTVLDDYRSALWAAEERLAYLEKQMSEAARMRPQLGLLVALQMLFGVGELTSATIVAEVGDFRRFARAGGFMNFAGLTASEHSSGERQQRGPITKAGNSNLRHVFIQAAHHARHQPQPRARLRARYEGAPPDLVEMAAKAHERLYHRYWHLGPTHRPGEGGGGGGPGVGRLRLGDGPADERSRPAGGVGQNSPKYAGGRADRGRGRQQAPRILLLRLR
jgi:transposase